MPTFGNSNSISPTPTALQNSSMVAPRLVVATDYTPAGAEYVQSASAYMSNAGGGTAYFKIALYDVTSGDTTSPAVAEWTVSLPVQALSWITWSLASFTLIAGHTYNIAFVDSPTNTVTYFLYRQTTTNKSINIGTSNRLFPNPAGASGGFSTVDPLIYFTTTTGQEITSINGGSPITAGQIDIPVAAEGFSAKPTSATATYDSGTKSIAASIGDGDEEDFEITIAGRADGGLYPRSGTSVALTFTKDAESDTITTTIVKKATETTVPISSPLFTAHTLANELLNQFGRTVATGDDFYHTQLIKTVDDGEPSDLVIKPDTDFTVTDAGSFDLWLYVSSGDDAGKNYHFAVTITESGQVIVTSGIVKNIVRSIAKSINKTIIH